MAERSATCSRGRFDFLPNSKIDAEGQLTQAALEAAQRGEALVNRPFEQMDGNTCAFCPAPNSAFVDRRLHVIGSENLVYGGDRAALYDTPTLLGAKFTAPYFHDSSLPTLTSMTQWFDECYGLGLDDAQESDLTAYVEAVAGADEPHDTFDAKNTPFRLAWGELTTFASTLSLLPARNADHANVVIDTVSVDLAADAGGM